MPTVAQILSAVESVVDAAVPVLTSIRLEPIIDDGDSELHPYGLLYRDDEWDVTEGVALQRIVRWPVSGVLVFSDGNHQQAALRAQLEQYGEAIEAGIGADPTLGGLVEHSLTLIGPVVNHPDDQRMFMSFAVAVEYVL